MRRHHLLALLLLHLAAACGGGRGAGRPTVDAGAPPDAGPVVTPPQDYAVYAHSAAELYRIDPDALTVQLVAPFKWPAGGSDQMTDIALDKDGNMTGISYGKVYAVDRLTGACTYLADLDREFNGLSFVPAAEIDASGHEVLVAAATDGAFYRLDPMTGKSTPVGYYGVGTTSSGDIVSVSGFGTVATVKRGLFTSDWVARIDVSTGQATPLFDTGVASIWGLGYWKGKLYGFTEDRQFVTIDLKTAKTTLVQAGQVVWWGAGVTTSAPVIN